MTTKLITIGNIFHSKVHELTIKHIYDYSPFFDPGQIDQALTRLTKTLTHVKKCKLGKKKLVIFRPKSGRQNNSGQKHKCTPHCTSSVPVYLCTITLMYQHTIALIYQYSIALMYQCTIVYLFISESDVYKCSTVPLY